MYIFKRVLFPEQIIVFPLTPSSLLRLVYFLSEEAALSYSTLYASFCMTSNSDGISYTSLRKYLFQRKIFNIFLSSDMLVVSFIQSY